MLIPSISRLPWVCLFPVKQHVQYSDCIAFSLSLGNTFRVLFFFLARDSICVYLSFIDKSLPMQQQPTKSQIRAMVKDKIKYTIRVNGVVRRCGTGRIWVSPGQTTSMRMQGQFTLIPSGRC